MAPPHPSSARANAALWLLLLPAAAAVTTLLTSVALHEANDVTSAPSLSTETEAAAARRRRPKAGTKGSERGSGRGSGVTSKRAVVLIVPGLGGSALRFTRSESESESESGQRAWMPLSLLAPKGRLDTAVWRRRMRVRYDADRDEFCGVARVRPYAGLAAVRRLNGTAAAGADPFGALIDDLQARGVAVHAFGYDFRRVTGARCWAHTQRRLARTLHRLHLKSGGAGVVVLTHSFGGVLFRAFSQQPQWSATVRACVRTFVPVAAPFGGSVLALRSVLTGATLNVCPIGPPGQHAWFQSVLSSYSSLLACLPTAFDAVVVRADGTAREYANEAALPSLLFDSGNHHAVQIWLRNVQPWLLRARAANDSSSSSPSPTDACVPTHAVLARGAPTATALAFTRARRVNRFADDGSFAALYACDVVRQSDGDGVVALDDQRPPGSSTAGSSSWYSETTIEDARHVDVLQRPELFALVMRLVT